MAKNKNAPPSRFQRWIDRTLTAIFFTPEGKPKSALLLYSFCLSLVFFVVYGVAYFFLIDVLENALAATASVTLRNIAQSIVPGLAGTVVCCLAWFIPGDKRLLPYTFLWLCAYAIILLVTMIFLLDTDQYAFFFAFFLRLVPVGVVSGTLASQILYRRWLRKRPPNAIKGRG